MPRSKRKGFRIFERFNSHIDNILKTCDHSRNRSDRIIKQLCETEIILGKMTETTGGKTGMPWHNDNNNNIINEQFCLACGGKQTKNSYFLKHKTCFSCRRSGHTSSHARRRRGRESSVKRGNPYYKTEIHFTEIKW